MRITSTTFQVVKRKVGWETIHCEFQVTGAGRLSTLVSTSEMKLGKMSRWSSPFGPGENGWWIFQNYSDIEISHVLDDAFLRSFLRECPYCGFFATIDTKNRKIQRRWPEYDFESVSVHCPGCGLILRRISRITQALEIIEKVRNQDSKETAMSEPQASVDLTDFVVVGYDAVATIHSRQEFDRIDVFVSNPDGSGYDEIRLDSPGASPINVTLAPLLGRTPGIYKLRCVGYKDAVPFTGNVLHFNYQPVGVSSPPRTEPRGPMVSVKPYGAFGSFGA